jgi:acetate kinase
MGDHVITLNAGSSSIKFALFSSKAEWPQMVAIGQIEGLGVSPEFEVRRATDKQKTKRSFTGADAPKNHGDAVKIILGWLNEAYPDAKIGAIGHRVVHGGALYSEPILLDDSIIGELEKFCPLAPLHQPHNLAGIAGATKAFPGIPQVACFDTAFHRTQPFVAETFALPQHFYDEGVRRYGFHGLSYEYISRRLQQHVPGGGKTPARVIICHLGNGASMTATRDGKAMCSTIGFSPLEGLPMGTRCGQIDPGVLLYLMQQKQMTAQQISDLLNKQSGLKGMSGISSDMRELEASDAPAAKQAIEYFCYRIRRETGSLAAALGGVDAIAFTGGIGSNSSLVREKVLSELGWLGVEFDREANNTRGTEVISTAKSPVRVFVMQTDEEAMIAQHTVRVAKAGAAKKSTAAA